VHSSEPQGRLQIEVRSLGELEQRSKQLSFLSLSRTCLAVDGIIVDNLDEQVKVTRIWGKKKGKRPRPAGP
jgi:hypothetical protein